MRLTKFTDYALRVLLIAASKPDQLVTIEETATLYAISAAHLKKVVLLLSRAGILRGVRGRSGGFTLARAPEDINLGEVVRLTEPDFGLVECFAPSNCCPISRHCGLPEVLNDALAAFVETFDRYTLADIRINACRFDNLRFGPQPQRGPSLPQVQVRAAE